MRDEPEGMFKQGVVSLLVLNVEEERILRSSDPHLRVNSGGQTERVSPDIRLQLSLLFVARFPKYEDGWNQLS